MSDDAIRFRREPPLFSYRDYSVLIVRNHLNHYVAYINGQRVRAPDVIPLEFVDYDSARKCAERCIDRQHVLRARMS